MRSRLRASGRHTAQGAYTLAEVLVGVLLVAVAATSLFAAFSSGFAVVGLQREDLRATQVMMRKIEGIRLCTWSQFPSTITFAEPYDPNGTTNNTAGVMYSGLLYTNSVTNILGSTTYAKDMRLVTVTINWTNTSSGSAKSSFGKPLPRSRTMLTFAARYGMQNYLWGAQ